MKKKPFKLPLPAGSTIRHSDTYIMLKRSFSVMPSRLVPMAMTSRVRPQNTWIGRYAPRNHDDATGNRKNSRPNTH